MMWLAILVALLLAPAARADLYYSPHDKTCNDTQVTCLFAASATEGGAASNLTCTDCVALTTETTGNYAAGDAEAGNATGLACTGSCVSDAEVDADLTVAGGVIGTSAITLNAGTAPTAEGLIEWNITSNRILVGDGAATQTFYSGAHTVDTTCLDAGVVCNFAASVTEGGAATTATALAANAANCAAGNYPLGVDASGAVESCTADSTGTDTLDDLSNNNITDLADVEVVTPAAGHVLVYDNVDARFENVSLGGDVLSTSATGNVALVAGLTRDTEWDTSPELIAAISDETGTGALVFGTSPTLTTPTITCTGCVTATNVAQGATADYTWLGTHDFGGSEGLELPNGTTPPGTCADWQHMDDTDAAPGNRLLYCLSNVWIPYDNPFGLKVGAPEMENSLVFGGSQSLDLNTYTAALRLPISTSDPANAGGLVIDTNTKALQWYDASTLHTGWDDRQATNEIWNGGVSPTGTVAALLFSDTTSTTTGGAGNATFLDVLASTGTHTLTATGDFAGLVYSLGRDAGIYNLGSTSDNLTLAYQRSFESLPVVGGDTTTVGIWTEVVGLYSKPTLTRTAGSATLTVSNMWGGYSGAVVNANTAATLRVGWSVADATGSGAITTQVGVDVAALTKGTTNIGIRNASTTVNTPSSNQTVTAGSTISPNATTVAITASGAVTTSTTTPITSGAQGQDLRIINVGANAITVACDDGSTSNCRAPVSARGFDASNDCVLGQYEYLDVFYNSTAADWIGVYCGS